MVYSKARLQDALRAFRQRPNCRDRRALPSEKLARRLRSSRVSAKVTPLDGVNWQAKSGASGSEDDEYNPDKERRLLAARRSKKKRKSEDGAGDDIVPEREAKKMKGDHTTSNSKSDNTFFTIRLTSEKGRQLLRSLGALGRVVRIGQGSSGASLSKVAPRSTNSYFDKYLSTDAAQAREVAGLVEGGLLEMDVDVQDEFVSNKHKILRSGKVVEKPAKKRKKSIKSTLHLNSPTSDDEIDQAIVLTKLSTKKKSQSSNRVHLNAFEKVRPVTKNFDYECVRGLSVFNHTGTTTDPISLDSDTEEMSTKLSPRPGIKTSLSPVNTKRISASPTIKQENSLPVSSISHTRPRTDPVAPQTTPTILTISTAFAHPLIFLSSTTHPAVASLQCHFCKDSRMAIIGLGCIRVEVFTDPDNPLAYQEMGQGFRSRNYESTTICFSCVEERIRMKNCHMTRTDPEQIHDAGENEDEDCGLEKMRVETRIDGVNANLLYRQWLFPTSAEKRDAKIREMEAPLQTCSLCPMPAQWTCCRDQSGRHAAAVKRGDLMSKQTETSRMIEAGAVPTASTSSRKISTRASRPSVGSEVIVVDSDSDGEPFAVVSKEVLQQRRRQNTSQAPAERPNPVSSTNRVNRGCGLMLCGNCKHLVVNRCHGVLDKKVIMAQFNNASQRGQIMTGRADVEFLFRGSVVERFYEQQMGQCVERSENQE